MADPKRPGRSSFWFACFDCGALAFLIQGSCEWCEPELHRAFQESMAEIRTVDAEYFRETGRRPLQDWYAFEKWCQERSV